MKIVPTVKYNPILVIEIENNIAVILNNSYISNWLRGETISLKKIIIKLV